MADHEQKNNELKKACEIELPLLDTHGLPLVEHPIKTHKPHQFQKTRHFEDFEHVRPTALLAFVGWCFSLC